MSGGRLDDLPTRGSTISFRPERLVSLVEAGGTRDNGAAGPEPLDGLSVDLGRHRAFAALTSGGQTDLIQLAPDATGVLLRTVYEGRTRRTVEVIAELAPIDRAAAQAIATSLADELMNAVHRTGLTEHMPWRISVPVSLGREARQVVLDGFAAAGVNLPHSGVVSRPVAAAAGWFGRLRRLDARPEQGLTLLVDNDGGEVSAIACHPEQRRVAGIHSLVEPGVGGSAPDPSQLDAALRAFVSSVSGSNTATDWPSQSAQIGQVVLTGTGAEHRGLQQLLRGLFPAAPMRTEPLFGTHDCTVTAGLADLEALADFTVTWPSLDLVLGSLLLRAAGPLDAAEPRSFVLAPGAILQLARDGVALDALHSGTRAGGITVPDSLGPFPTLRLSPEGDLHMAGTGIHERMIISIGWPAPGSRGPSFEVTSIRKASTRSGDRREADRRSTLRPETLHDVQPEPSRQPE